jgi:transcriptional regulator with XRE-family HTH domain
MTATATSSEFGASLRWWRTTRRYSQLELANQAEVSSRHLSFLETGRANPSREMVVHLANVLDLPLRDSNSLLHAAGYAPVYSEADFDGPEMAAVRSVLTTLLDAHQPNPATVVDRLGNLIIANDAAGHLMAALVDPESPAFLPTPNLLRLTLHPDGIRARTTNWIEVAAALLLRLERERNHRPADVDLDELYHEMVAYPGVAELRSHPRPEATSELVVPLRLTTADGAELSLLTTISILGSPNDVTLDELRLETFLPADQPSSEILDGWASPHNNKANDH